MVFVSDNLFLTSCSVLVLLVALSFSRLILSLSFLCSSVSEALFALDIEGIWYLGRQAKRKEHGIDD